MSQPIAIPEDHWQPIAGQPNWRQFIPAWEVQLRANIAELPDPAARFSVWLSRLAYDEPGPGAPVLFFIEQPYLSWALDIIKALHAHEKRVRGDIAADIVNP